MTGGRDDSRPVRLLPSAEESEYRVQPGPGRPGHLLAHQGDALPFQGWKFMSWSLCQELCQLAVRVSDWLFTLVQPIRSRLAC